MVDAYVCVHICTGEMATLAVLHMHVPALTPGTNPNHVYMPSTYWSQLDHLPSGSGRAAEKHRGEADGLIQRCTEDIHSATYIII